MAEIQNSEIVSFNLGDRVRLKEPAGRIGRITELRGPLGPGGVAVYRVLIQRKPTAYIEVLGRQLELLPVIEKKKKEV